MRNHGKYRQFVEGNEPIIVRSYNMARFLHKLRWAFYRIGLNQNGLSAMIAHNRIRPNNKRSAGHILEEARQLLKGLSSRVIQAT